MGYLEKGNRRMPRWHIPNCDGGMCKLWTWWWEKNNLIEDNETKINDDDGDDTEVNYKDGYESTETESSTSEEVGEKHKIGKNIISGKYAWKLWRWQKKW